jgi:DNA-binding response OmpR family regulator
MGALEALKNMKKLLLVEDEKMTKDIYVTKFQEQNDIKVITAVTAKEADEILKNEDIDLIVLDIVLPGEDGLMYLERLNKGGNSAPVVILSNLEGKEYREKAKNFGAMEYFLKTDYTPTELLELIKKNLKLI